MFLIASLRAGNFVPIEVWSRRVDSDTDEPMMTDPSLSSFISLKLLILSVEMMTSGLMAPDFKRLTRQCPPDKIAAVG